MSSGQIIETIKKRKADNEIRARSERRFRRLGASSAVVREYESLLEEIEQAICVPVSLPAKPNKLGRLIDLEGEE